MTCSEDQLGRRDVFHVPAVVVFCRYELAPGTLLKFVGKNEVGVVSWKDQRQGIVDPFLTNATRANEPFWMFVDPRLVGDLTHQFTIDGVDVKGDSERGKPDEEEGDYCEY